MRSGLPIKAVALISLLAFFAAAAIRTRHAAAPNFGDVGRALTIVAVVSWLYEQVLWRWNPLGPPDLHGTWKLLLTPREGASGASRSPKPGYLSIKQTASTLAAQILFEDGESQATTATLAKDNFGTRLLLFYDFVPSEATDDNMPRKGATSLKITDDGLGGKYWNDRRIWGDLSTEGRARKQHKTYNAAKSGTYSSH